MTNAVFTKGEGNQGTLTFDVPVAVYQKGIDQAFDEVKKDVTAPGFRRGKMPKQIFMQMYGEESLYNDGLNKVLPEVFDDALAQTGVQMVGQPNISVVSMEKGKDWKLSAEIEIAPEIELGQYKGIEVPAADTTVTDEEVDAELARLQKEQAELVLVDRPAEDGDTVVIDFDGSVDGDHFDGGKAENYSLELGSGSFIPGFEEQLIGAKADDQVDVKVTFPENYQAKDLAGKEALFEVTVHEVKAKEVPALDDEFAKDVDENVDSLTELKTKLRDQMQDKKDEEAKAAKEDNAVNGAVDNAKIVGDRLPEAMIKEDVDRQLNQFFASIQQQGITPDLYFQITGQNAEGLRQQYAEGADRRVKTGLVLDAIAKAENIQPSEQEIAKEVKALAEQYNMEEDAVRNALTDDMLAHDIAVKQVVDLIVDSAIVK